MHMKNNIRNFLMEQDYAIHIFEDCIHVFKYIDIDKIQDDEIILRLELFTLKIKGDNFRIQRLEKNEILIKGNIHEMSFVR